MNGHSNLTREEAAQIAKEAASEALVQFFKYFDLNIEDEASIKAFRKDLEHLRKQRTDIEKARNIIRWTGLATIIALIPPGLVWVWNVFIPWVQRQ